MPESLTWTLNVQVVGGPKISAYDTLTVGATQKLFAFSNTGDKDITVSILVGRDVTP